MKLSVTVSRWGLAVAAATILMASAAQAQSSRNLNTAPGVIPAQHGSCISVAVSRQGSTQWVTLQNTCAYVVDGYGFGESPPRSSRSQFFPTLTPGQVQRFTLQDPIIYVLECPNGYRRASGWVTNQPCEPGAPVVRRRR